jgi:O-acetyl-ADP-ribose deacetylase (regulator of RNase III)
MATIEVVNADITTIAVDVIVNAANGTLLGGGGVDGAIHRAAGVSVFKECWRLGQCRTGEVCVTSAGNLPARLIFHAVGPKFEDGKRGEPDLLVSVYKKIMLLARQHNIRSIALPPISCGTYRFPVDLASNIAVQTVLDALPAATSLHHVVFACLGDTYDVYNTALADAFKKQRI